MRAGQFLEGYAKHFDIDLAVILVSGADPTETEFVKTHVSRYRVFDNLPSDSHYALIERLADANARLAAFVAYGRPSIARVMTPTLKADLAVWIGDVDYAAIHIMRHYLAPLTELWAGRSQPDRPVLMLDCDEDEARTHFNLARCRHRLGERDTAQWVLAEARAFGRVREAWSRPFDCIYYSAPDDVRLHPGARHVPNTAELPQRPRRPRVGATHNLLFLGTLDYAPNTEAVLWFLRRVWPLLRRSTCRKLRCRFVGPRPIAAMLKFATNPDFEIPGPVPDVSEAYGQADLAIIPVLSGGGTRIKVIEAAAHGIPIVATRLGASGLDLRHERDLLIADSPRDFARACARLIEQPRMAEALAARAQYRVRRLYSRNKWVDQIGQLASNMIDASNRDMEDESSSKPV